MQGEEALYSSKKQDWGTPIEFMTYLKEELGIEPTLDVASSHHNAKARNYYTKEDNGLRLPWPGVVWCNPPFGRELKEWLAKAVEEANTWNRIYFLIPARTDTKYFHELIWPHARRIWFVKGRMNFDFEGSVRGANAPFPSMLVQFGGPRGPGLESILPFVCTLEPSPAERGWPQ